MFGEDDQRKRGGDRFNRPGRFDEPDRLPWMEAVEEDQKAGMGKGQKRFLLIIGALLTLSLFTSLIFYAYDRGKQQALSGGGEPPVVLASDGPAKIQPDDRGGLNVPDQDRLVFNALNNQTGQAGDAGQGFTAPPEQPLERPAATRQTPVQDTQVQDTPVQAAPVEQPVFDDPTTTSPIATTTQTSLAQTPTTVIPAGAFRIQLGAFGSSRSTEIAWGQLQDRHPVELGRLNLEIEPLSRAGSLTLFRLRAGPLPTRADADAACVALRSAGQGCFVVAP